MRNSHLRYDRGASGTAILLSLVVSLFIIGLIVMIFALMGGSLKSADIVDESNTESSSQLLVNVTTTGATLNTCNNKPIGALTTITAVNSTGGESIDSANYTLANCVVSAASGSTYASKNWNITAYTFTFAGSAYSTINDTVTGISGVSDYFDLFVVIGAMVVLILLTVIIIVAIRNSGMISTSGTA